MGENLTSPAKVLIYTCWRRPWHGRLGSVWGVDVPCLLKDVGEERGWSLVGWPVCILVTRWRKFFSSLADAFKK